MRFFKLTGYARRRELLVVTALLSTAALLFFWLRAGPYWSYSRYAVSAVFVLLAVQFSTTIRRLRDIDRSALWAALLFVPLAGGLLTLALLCWPPAGRKRIGTSRALVLGHGVMALLLALAFGRLFWQPVWVPTESMKPSLLVGDMVLSRHRGLSELERGDIILFRHGTSGADHAARLIGLPGDRVQLRSGLVWLNGQLLPQVAAGTFSEPMAPQGPYRLRPRCKGALVGDGGLCQKARLTETIPAQGDAPARKYDVLNIENGAYADDTAIFVVPEAQVFVLGDNRDNSADSRYSAQQGGMGFVPAENIIGRLGLVLFSAEGDALWKIWTWRADRVLKGVE